MSPSHDARGIDNAIPPPRVQEQLLIDALDELRGEVILATTAGLCQLPMAAARTFPAAQVHCLFLDLYPALLNAERFGLPLQVEMAFAPTPTHRTSEPLPDVPRNLALHCACDFPSIEADVVALPLSASGEAELARDLLQTGHERLRIGGMLAASTDNPRDRWLEQEMRKLSPDVNRRTAAGGIVYTCRKNGPLKKVKNFACQFVFRDREHLIHAYSRPGVFAHRRVDPGARQLMNVMEIAKGERILEVGCGSGASSLAAAMRADGVTAHAIDSSTRAVACTRRGAELNGLAHVTAQLDARGDISDAGEFQLVLANPPYYANFRIARHFLDVAQRALIPGGRLLLVTKQPDWYAEQAPALFRRVQIFESKGYYVVSAEQR